MKRLLVVSVILQFLSVIPTVAQHGSPPSPPSPVVPGVPQECPGHCASDMCANFPSETLSNQVWTTVHGNPMTGPPHCKLRLPCSPGAKSEIQSIGEMLYGTLAFHNTQCTAWNEAPTSVTDIYFGWQIFIGNCHSAILVDDGTLAIISYPPGGNCTPDPPHHECYLAIPDWDAGAYNGPHTYVLSWTPTEVVLYIDGRRVVSASNATCPMPLPAVPMKVDLSCNLDGGLQGTHFLETEVIVSIGSENPFK